jgi:hypothetical protein
MALKISLQLPDDVYQRVVHYARARNQDVETAIVDYLEQNLPEGRLPNQEAMLDADLEVAAYAAMHPILKQQYEGEYVAIYRGKLIDHDSDRLALFERIEKAYPDQFVLMRPVEPAPEREFHFRSPRLERRIL